MAVETGHITTRHRLKSLSYLNLKRSRDTCSMGGKRKEGGCESWLQTTSGWGPLPLWLKVKSVCCDALVERRGHWQRELRWLLHVGAAASLYSHSSCQRPPLPTRSLFSMGSSKIVSSPLASYHHLGNPWSLAMPHPSPVPITFPIFLWIAPSLKSLQNPGLSTLGPWLTIYEHKKE